MNAYLTLAENFVEDFYGGDCDWTKVPSHLLVIRSVVDSALDNLEQLDKITDEMAKAKNKTLVKQAEDYEHYSYLLYQDVFYIAMHWFLNDEATMN